MVLHACVGGARLFPGGRLGLLACTGLATASWVPRVSPAPSGAIWGVPLKNPNAVSLSGDAVLPLLQAQATPVSRGTRGMAIGAQDKVRVKGIDRCPSVASLVAAALLACAIQYKIPALPQPQEGGGASEEFPQEPAAGGPTPPWEKTAGESLRPGWAVGLVAGGGEPPQRMRTMRRCAQLPQPPWRAAVPGTQRQGREQPQRARRSTRAGSRPRSPHAAPRPCRRRPGPPPAAHPAVRPQVGCACDLHWGLARDPAAPPVTAMPMPARLPNPRPRRHLLSCLATVRRVSGGAADGCAAGAQGGRGQIPEDV